MVFSSLREKIVNQKRRNASFDVFKYNLSKKQANDLLFSFFSNFALVHVKKLPIMRIHRHGRQRKASARSGEAKASEKINLKKCLTLQINSLECTSALREKLL
ncbi:TPA: hypothetical protein ACGUWK_003104, partial [Vibrio vulnificus]